MQTSPAVRTRGYNTRRIRPLAVVAAIVGSAVGISSVCAEPDPVEGPHRAELLAAHAVARVALMDLKTVGNPTARDYRIAEEMLAIASSLQPNDQTILRLYMEAAAGADDAQALREISRRLVKLDPDDTVALLRVVSAKISDLQTAEQRLAAYDRFSRGEGSETFDASVRSRLALDGALLAREQGDMLGFADRLASAIELDPTNRDAATLGLTFYSANADETKPTGRLDLMFSVLWTDPFDPSIYSSIVSELLGGGAYKGALRFAKLQRTIYNVQSRPIPDGDENALDLAEWWQQGPDAVIRRLSDALEKRRQFALEERKRAQEKGLATEAFPSPENVRLSASRERSRLICAASMLDRERSSIFLADMASTVNALVRDAADPVRRPAGMTEEQATAYAASASIDLCWLRLLTGLQMEEVGKKLAAMHAFKELPDSVLARFDAWMELRSGNKSKGEEMLATLAPTDPFAAIGHALAAELRDDPNTAMVRNEAIARANVGTVAGAFAATRYTALSGERIAPSDAAKALEADALGVPTWLDSMVENPRRAMSLEVKALRPDVSPIERTPVRVTLRNTSQIALPMGPDKPLCTRLLFAPLIIMGSDTVPTADLVWIANMDRRLRLLPNESVDVIVWPDLGPLSFDLEWWLPRQSNIRWRVLQGFELSAQRLYDSAPQMLTADVDSLIRRIPPRADAPCDSLQSALQTGGTREIVDVLLSLKLQLVSVMRGSELPLTPERIDQLFEVLSRHLSAGKYQRSTKLLIMCLAPSQKLLSQTLRLDQVFAQDTDEDVLAVALVLRTTGPTDPLFTSPAVLRSPRLTALAQMVKERMEAGTIGFGIAPLQPLEIISTVPQRPATTTQPTKSVPNSAPGTGQGQPEQPRREIVPTVVPDPNPVPIVY